MIKFLSFLSLFLRAVNAAETSGYLIDKQCVALCEGVGADQVCTPDGVNVFFNPEAHTKWCLLLSVCVSSGYVLMSDVPSEDNGMHDIVLDLTANDETRATVLSFIQAGSTQTFPKVTIEYNELETEEISVGQSSGIIQPKSVVVKDPWGSDSVYYSGNDTYQILCANADSPDVEQNNLCFRSDVVVTESESNYVIESNGCPDHVNMRGSSGVIPSNTAADGSSCGAGSCGACGAGSCGVCGAGSCGACGAGSCGASGSCGVSSGIRGATRRLQIGDESTSCNACGASGCGASGCAATVGNNTYNSCGACGAGSCGACGAGSCGACGAGSCGVCGADSCGVCGAGSCGVCGAGSCGVCGADSCGVCGAGSCGACGAGSCGACGAGSCGACGAGSCGACGAYGACGACGACGWEACGACDGGSGGTSDDSKNTYGTYDPLFQHYSMTIPMNPGEPGEATYLTSNNDVVGILTNGVLLDSHQPTWAYDSCNGHSDTKHQYHYHIPPQCFLQAMGVPTPDNTEWWIMEHMGSTTAVTTERTVTDGMKTVRDFSDMAAQWPATASTASPIIGFARDGYPIFGPYDENGDLQRGRDYGGDLDECNGKMNSAGSYGYYLTVDPPFAPPCLRGEIGLFTSLSTNKMCPADGIVNTIINQSDGFPDAEDVPTTESSITSSASSNNKRLSVFDMALLVTAFLAFYRN